MDEWLHTKALQHQNKHLSVTDVLLDQQRRIAGYYTLATSQVGFEDLPSEVAKHLPRRALPVAILAWLGVDEARQAAGIGRTLLACALRGCYEAGKTFAFVAVILDCISEGARAFYQNWDFEGIPGHPYRLFLSAKRLDAMMGRSDKTPMPWSCAPRSGTFCVRRVIHWGWSRGASLMSDCADEGGSS